MVLVWLYNSAQFHPRLPRNTMFKFSEVALILLGLTCLWFLLLDLVLAVLEDRGSNKPL